MFILTKLKPYVHFNCFILFVVKIIGRQSLDLIATVTLEFQVFVVITNFEDICEILSLILNYSSIVRPKIDTQASESQNVSNI